VGYDLNQEYSRSSGRTKRIEVDYNVVSDVLGWSVTLNQYTIAHAIRCEMSFIWNTKRKI